MCALYLTTSLRLIFYATNCPCDELSGDELSATNCPATNCPPFVTEDVGVLQNLISGNLNSAKATRNLTNAKVLEA